MLNIFRKIIIFTGLCFSLCNIFAQARLSHDEVYKSKAKIFFKTKFHDFKDVLRGEKLEYNFKFKNIGKGPLMIQGVHAACGCIAVNVDTTKIYKSGEEGGIDVKLDTKDFKGKLSKYITVITNALKGAAHNLTIKANIKEEIAAYPPIVDFGDIHVNLSPTKTFIVKVMDKGNPNIDVKGFSYNTKLYFLSYEKSIKGKWIVSLKLRPDLYPGFYKDTIYVSNTSKALPRLPVLMRVKILGNISYNPQYIEFGAIDYNGRSKRVLSFNGITNYNIIGFNLELKLKGSELKNPKSYISYSLEDAGNFSKKAVLNLINKSKESGTVHGKLFFKTTQPGQENLTIDFYAFFKGEKT